MQLKYVCRGALAVCVVLFSQSSVMNCAKADDTTATQDSGWVADPAVTAALTPAQMFGKFSVQIPAGYTADPPIAKTVENGTDTLYKFTGPKRKDHSYPQVIVYVLQPTTDGTAPSPLPASEPGIHYLGQGVGTINGLNVVHHVWNIPGGKHLGAVTETGYTCTDGVSKVTVAGLDVDKHFSETLPAFTACALSLHE